ncbi:MAG: DUF2924 domain-containing protein [Maritimibacter sp.]|nr:DUF2924 domain-containing protein [Maritimibacter sp.]
MKGAIGVGAPKPLAEALADLDLADRPQLLDLWRAVIGAPPPKNLSLPFLRRALAFELQCAALGGPKKRVIEDLERIADGKPAHASVGAKLQPGARLVREWQGRSWTVEVVEGGFLMGGERYASLSAIARKITGARWSGPRFFGLTGGSGKEHGSLPDVTEGNATNRKVA